MKSFEEHLRGAKAHNREDKIWLVTCFSGKMAKLCAKYGFPDDEDKECIAKMNGLHILFHYVEACQCKLRFHPKSIGLSHATQFSIIHENKNLL